MGFSPHKRIQLVPTLIYSPHKADDQVVRIASGADHTLALLRNGSVLSWGNGQQGQLGRVGERMSDRVKLATLLEPHVMPIKKARGAGKSVKIADVNCGTYASWVVTTDGSVYTCGLNNYGQLGLHQQEPVYAPTFVKALLDKNVKAVKSGQHHTLVITEQGRLLSFGRPTYGRLGQKDADVSADSACPEVKQVDGLDGITVVSAAAGLAVSGCIDADGTVYMWGFGTSNQLGKGDDDEDEIVPKKLAETKKYSGYAAVQLEFGGQHVAMLCVKKDEGGAGGSA